jgi:ElaB/YqjD/DUF883 family membrane-anchored ribosome-binding protein
MREKTETESEVDFEQFLDDIKVVMQDGQELLKTGFGTAKQQATAGLERAARFTRERPYQSIGIAFGIGILAGIIAASALKRRLDRNGD